MLDSEIMCEIEILIGIDSVREIERANREETES